MQPRFILKTHLKSLKPGNYSMLITKCTYPDKSSNVRHVERALLDYLKLSSVAKFTILTATEKNRGFGFLSDNLTWSWKGHVINAVIQYSRSSSEDPINYLNLNRFEQIAYFKYFLETEGAFLLKLAELFSNQEVVTYDFLKLKIEEIFLEIFYNYLDVAPDLKTRLAIRESIQDFKKIKRGGGYNSATLVHKIKPHIEALNDLHLLSIEIGNHNAELYKPILNDGISPFRVIYDLIKSIENMENHFFTSTDNYYLCIANALNLKINEYLKNKHDELLYNKFAIGYKYMQNRFNGLADIDALLDWCRITMLVENNIIVKEKDFTNLIDKLLKENSSSIRYHLNGKGRIAYIIAKLL